MKWEPHLILSLSAHVHNGDFVIFYEYTIALFQYTSKNFTQKLLQNKVQLYIAVTDLNNLRKMKMHPSAIIVYLRTGLAQCFM